MAGIMSSMYTGVSGLQASQNAINTTAHNLTNVNTEGYSRQQILLTDLNYSKISASAVTSNTIGMGTKVQSTRVVRDRFLDDAYRNENGRQAFYLAQYEAISEVENYFGELEGNSFRKCIQDLWGTLQEVNNESNNIVTRSDFIGQANIFVKQANTIYKQLVDFQVNLNSKIISQVDRINKIADEILEVNKAVIAVEASKVENANDLRDTRNKLLDELSALIDINVEENADGSIDVNIDGRTLVTVDRAFKLGTTTVEGNKNFLKPIWKDDGDDLFNFGRIPSAENNTDKGSLKGLMMSRGDVTPTYTAIPVRPKESDYQGDTAAYNVALAQYNKDVDEYNLKVEPYGIANILATFDTLIHGIVTAINDILCPNTEVTLADGTSIKILDEEKAGIGMGENNDYAGTELFVRNSVSRYTEQTVTLADGSTKTVKVYNEESADDYYSLYSLGNLKVNSELLKNPSLLPINNQDGGENQEVTQQLLKLWDSEFSTLNPNIFVMNNFEEYYTALVGDFADKAKTYNDIAVSEISTLSQIEEQRQQVVGVSSDEELSNLIRFQHAYNAASRYITVIDNMLEHIINRLG